MATYGGAITMDADQSNDVWLTPEELADLLRVHRQTIYRELRAGHLPGVIKIGNQWRIPKNAALKALAGRRQPQEPEP
jgi:excisionase family DNA binding protein